ncbi:cytochrome P450, cyclodipeptide synthase-associated [Staphylococcus pseudoxylosus]|uniref:cytochrome P450, cyclodipeptide synthase-associated n=1 Tax=Staphylococcus pseudoxylosus TaxID=2282419 RepID=UPI00398B1F2E
MKIKNNSVFSSEYETNPVPTFKVLREESPVHYDEEVDAYLISRYEDVKYVLKNNDIFTTKTLATRAEPVMKDRVLAQMKGHEHKGKKAAILKGMTGKYLEKLIPIIKKRTNDIIDQNINNQKELDIVNDFGKVFAVQSSMDLLGINVNDSEKIRGWHNGIAKFITSFNLTDEEIKHSLYCSDKLEEYLMPLIKERRNSEADDLISLLHQYGNDENKISDSEILALTLNILLAATEPVDKTLSYLFYNLSNHQSQFKAVIEDRTLVKDAIQETLRFNSPVQLIPRQVSEDTNINGVKLYKDDVVICMIGSANRDEEAFSNPNEFNIYRRLEKSKPFTSHSQNLSFGSGVHTCVGAALSMIQLELVTNIILDRLKDIKLKDNVLVEEGIYTRGAKELMISFK